MLFKWGRSAACLAWEVNSSWMCTFFLQLIILILLNTYFKEASTYPEYLFLKPCLSFVASWSWSHFLNEFVFLKLQTRYTSKQNMLLHSRNEKSKLALIRCSNLEDPIGSTYPHCKDSERRGARSWYVPFVKTIRGGNCGAHYSCKSLQMTRQFI